MVAHARYGIIVVITALSLLAGCASSPYVGTGAALGGGLGAITGAAIGNRNPWQGAAIGSLIGTAWGPPAAMRCSSGRWLSRSRATITSSRLNRLWRPGPL